ncbi:hypothetical protein [Pseudomonas laurylsulfatiphila]|uniref:hypothetical protein n=1 Tax=Pseudomonas laurylsulfatiphila TaxID=2011015 RepID=UPI003D23F475
MTKIKVPLFSPTQYATHMNESIGNTTARVAIGRNHRTLWNCFFEPLLEHDEYIKLLEDIRAVTSDPALQGKLMDNWENEVYECNEEINGLNEEINITFQHVRHACLYLELATAAEKDKDHNRTWAFNNEASLMVGKIAEKSETILNKITADSNAKQNSKNGKGRIKSFLPAKEEAARLLDEMKPEGGWLTVVSAASALEEPLGSFIDANRIGGIKSSNIRNLLEKKWIPKDMLVNSAWQKNKRLQK